jgi:membrane-bound lytic murein transglycosylase B
MRGAWAGEIGQTQFMAEAYYKYAVDFDGNGRRDLINSHADVVASTANYLKGYGWKRGQGWQPGSHNYNVLREWNRAGVYVKTIAKMAEQMQSGNYQAGKTSTQQDKGSKSSSGSGAGSQSNWKIQLP